MPIKKKLQLKWKRLSGNHTNVPTRATDGSAGYDIELPQGEHFSASQIREVALGWAVEIPEGYMGFLRIRSGKSIGDNQLIMQSTGIIDSDYRGELKAYITQFRRAYPVGFDQGERLVQLVVLPIPDLDSVEVEELTDTKREGGFGSTGK